MDPMTLVPEAWRAWLALAVTYAFAALAVTTIAAHTLLPIAQRIEQWAIASSVTWDNKPARKLVEILAWLCGLTDLLWALPRFTIGRSDPERREERSKLNGARPPDSGALALVLVVVAACAVWTSGCSAGPQLPVVTVPINIACSWNINPPRSSGEATVDTPTSADATASWVVADNDCTVDRSSAAGEANPIGNDLHGAEVSPSLTASVPISGTGGATP